MRSNKKRYGVVQVAKHHWQVIRCVIEKESLPFKVMSCETHDEAKKIAGHLNDAYHLGRDELGAELDEKFQTHLGGKLGI